MKTRTDKKVAEVLEEQLRKSLPLLKKNRRVSISRDLAIALVREGWVLPQHI